MMCNPYRLYHDAQWSNGQAEGHVNWLKLIKRHMQGGAKVDLIEASGLTETEESEGGFRSGEACASLAHAQWDIDHSQRHRPAAA